MLLAVMGHRQPSARGLACSALTLLAVLVPAGCAPPAQSGRTTAPSPTSGGLSIPAERMTPFNRCMIDAGFRVTGEQPPSFAGDKPTYIFESDLPATEGMAKLMACRQKFEPFQPKTEAELRDIYDRWVDERDCLVRLGYQPAEPPSIEKFVADWRTGSWMPIDGIDTRSWTDAQYQEAKDRCTLEMYDRS